MKTHNPFLSRLFHFQIWEHRKRGSCVPQGMSRSPFPVGERASASASWCKSPVALSDESQNTSSERKTELNRLLGTISFGLGVVAICLVICPCSKAQQSVPCNLSSATDPCPCQLSGAPGVPFSANLATLCTNPPSTATVCPLLHGSIPFAPGIGTLAGCTISGTPTQEGLFNAGVFQVGANNIEVQIIISCPVSVNFSYSVPIQYMMASFTPPLTADNQQQTLLDYAHVCGFESFNWQQMFTVRPYGINPSGKNLTPKDPSQVASNVYPPGCSRVAAAFWPLFGCALVAGPKSSSGNVFDYPAFRDPPKGAYVGQPSSFDPYPFYYPSYAFTPGAVCTQADPNTLQPLCPPFPYVSDGTTLSFLDDPTTHFLPGDKPSPNPAPGNFVAFKTSLVGVDSQGNVHTLRWWTWNSTFNGTAGGVDQSSSIYPIDPGSGTGGVTITSINGVPQKPPSVSCTATPNTLWPPDGKSVAVTVVGILTPGTQAIPPGGTTYAVSDKYGQVQPSGGIALNAGGSFSFPVSLIAARNGDDRDGRTYTIDIIARDQIGNVGSCSAVVTVPHDQGH